ncbi:Serine/threonine-protein kinase Aurora-3 [Gracilariopsis chorda]|uniref:Serine/threonine-protein kinase Aurora-3 n=1 Tax=Gracilariopsis chorda TaxID=448386 RepID=A0A2V3IZQ0_9FLOR|nr:Serine/threonine-protein kinase Aurora-3 [Gracilariopsis chorda]|eukprot:PXF47624.1 Serine/threonine-protein kinase Aurora-3 [Gracilariopsis chorda]
MKGWLATREGLLRTQRYFFRLQWGFLTQHLTETSAAIVRYFIHGARIRIGRGGLRVVVELGVLGMAFAEWQGSSTRVLLIAGDSHVFQRWVTCLYRAKNRDIRRWYQLGETLGRGIDGVVRLGISVENGQLVAVKRIALFTMNADVGMKLRFALQEIQMQHKAAKRSSHVAAVLDVFYDDEFCYLVMQYGNKGSLCRLLAVRNGNLGEAFVRIVMIQLGRCLLSLHQSNLIHRDIKCDNVLIAHSRRAPLHVLLCDFGFATVWRPESRNTLSRFCKEPLGTEAYLAPEVLRGEWYGAPVDIFALGVLCHVCLTGTFPFESSSRRRTLRRIERGTLEKLDSAEISEDAKSFTRALLNKDPYKRLTAVALLQHPWLRGRSRYARRNRTSPRATWKRTFHAVSVMLAMQRLARRAPETPGAQQRSAVSFQPQRGRRKSSARAPSTSTSYEPEADSKRTRIRSEVQKSRPQRRGRRRLRTAGHLLP